MTTTYCKKPKVLTEELLSGHAVIEASAGTGKTYTLTHLVVDLLLKRDDLDLSELLIVTFTRRATADLKGQVRKVLAEVINEDSTTPPDTPYWAIDDRARARLTEVMHRFDQAQIYTIHSFCQKILNDYAFHNDQLFELTWIDEETLFDECFEEFLRGPATNDKHLRKFLDAWLGEPLSDTQENLCKKLRKLYSGYGEISRIYEKPDDAELIHEATEKKKFSGRYGYNKDNRGREFKAIALRELLEQLEEFIEAKKRQDGLYCYSDMLSMVARRVRAAADGDETARELVDRIRSTYKVALIDEFQDTDGEQWELFRTLFVDGSGNQQLYIIGDPKQAIYSFRGADVWTYLRAKDDLLKIDNSVLAALDINYRSTPEMVDAYNEIFLHDVGDKRFLTNEDINYEDPVAANKEEPFQVRYAKETRRGEQPKAIKALHIAEGGLTIDDLRGRWLDWMATEIESLLSGDERIQTRKLKKKKSKQKRYRDINAGDIYILCNSGRNVGNVANCLRERGIPYALYRQDGLLQSHQALDILSVLAAIVSPGERSKRRSAFRTPFFGIPLAKLLYFDEQSPAGEKAREKLKAWRELAERRRFDALFEQLMNQTRVVRRELFFGDGERGITNYGHIFEILAGRANTGQGVTLEDLVLWLSRRHANENDNGDNQDGNLQRLETDRPAVQIMTMHKSKGLQAEVVFVYGGYNTKTPKTFINSDDPGDEQETPITVTSTNKKYYLPSDVYKRSLQQAQWESERLMYVAITRAKSRLYLTYADPLYEDQRKTPGRGGRHEALCRALDRIGPGGHEQIEFVDVGEVGSHRESREVEQLSARDILNNVDQLRQIAGRADSIDANFSSLADRVRQSFSFSGVKYKGSVEIAVEAPEEEPALAAEEKTEEEAEQELADDRFGADTAILGGGPKSGNLLHDILEFIDDYSLVYDAASAEEWAAYPEIAGVIDEQMKRHGYAAKYRAYTARILFDTLLAPLELPDGTILDGVAAADRHGKEVPFRFPVPQRDLDFRDWPDDGPTIKMGWIEGYIDLVFEAGDKIYIADWKSNSRPDYEPAQLAPYMDNHYGLQARLYTQATVRLLGITTKEEYDARFGGCAYFFVRGMRPEDEHRQEGILWYRPDWAELQNWERWLYEKPPHLWKEPKPIFSRQYGAQ